MSMLQSADHRGKVGRLALRLAMALAMVGAGLGRAHAATDATDATDATEPAGAAEAAGAARAVDDSEAAALVPQDTARRRKRASPLDRRVMLLARELGLDATQQAQVKKVLEAQREQVARLWNDKSIPAARRVSATQAIGDRTADRIRALLNDEQRKRYIKPRHRDVAVGTAGGDVESWMNAGKRK
ncbi:MAG TPA: hypothetical protein VEP46_05040 [Vicinamibacterales bacterium]|nr:hypothetical protein [Vicinamibacterales bacterium]